MPKKRTLEESFAQLDTLLEQMQQKDLTLEESFQKYEEGMKLIKYCTQAIDKVEKKLEIMQEQETLHE